MAFFVLPGNIMSLRNDIKMLKAKGIWKVKGYDTNLLSSHFGKTKPSLELRQLIKYRFEELNEDLFKNENKDSDQDQNNDKQLNEE